MLLDRLSALSAQYGSEYDRRYTESADKYDRLVTLITATGYEPTDEELALAGMSRKEAEAWQAYYNSIGYYAGGVSRGRSGRSGGSQTETGSAASGYTPITSHGGLANSWLTAGTVQPWSFTPVWETNRQDESILLPYADRFESAGSSPSAPTQNGYGLIQSDLNSGAAALGARYADLLTGASRQEQVQQQRADRL